MSFFGLWFAVTESARVSPNSINLQERLLQK